MIELPNRIALDVLAQHDLVDVLKEKSYQIYVLNQCANSNYWVLVAASELVYPY